MNRAAGCRGLRLRATTGAVASVAVPSCTLESMNGNTPVTLALFSQFSQSPSAGGASGGASASAPASGTPGHGGTHALGTSPAHLRDWNVVEMAPNRTILKTRIDGRAVYFDCMHNPAEAQLDMRVCDCVSAWSCCLRRTDLEALAPKGLSADAYFALVSEIFRAGRAVSLEFDPRRTQLRWLVVPAGATSQSVTFKGSHDLHAVDAAQAVPELLSAIFEFGIGEQRLCRDASAMQATALEQRREALALLEDLASAKAEMENHLYACFVKALNAKKEKVRATLRDLEAAQAELSQLRAALSRTAPRGELATLPPTVSAASELAVTQAAPAPMALIATTRVEAPTVVARVRRPVASVSPSEPMLPPAPAVGTALSLPSTGHKRDGQTANLDARSTPVKKPRVGGESTGSMDALDKLR